MPHTIYCTTHCYGAPFPDSEGRPPMLSVLSLSDDGADITIVQETPFPAGTGCPMVLQLDKTKSKLFSIGGVNGVVVFEVDQADQGKVVEGKQPVCSSTTTSVMPTPLGDFPAWVTFDGQTVYVANFFASSVTAMPFDHASNTCGAPVECKPVHAGTPEKVLKALDPNEEPGPFGAGFPENGSHPHGISIHPSGKWMVLSDLGTNDITVYSLPVGKSFAEGPPDFTLQLHTAFENNKNHGAGPKNNCFSKDGKVLFCCNELDSSASSYAFDESTGALTPLGDHLAVPRDWFDAIPPKPLPFYDQCTSGGSLVLSPDGKHFYTSNRGHDSIACFAIGSDGGLTPTVQYTIPSGGRIAWNLTMPSATLLLVVNQYAADPEAMLPCPGGDPNRVAPAPKGPGNVTVFKRNPETGELTPTGTVLDIPEPLGILAANMERHGF